MPFENEIAGGQGTITRPRLKSENYVPGTSGWAIMRDGSAEFTGAVIVGGDLLVSDPDGSYVHIFDENPGVGAVIAYKPADQLGHVFAEGQLKTAWTGDAGYMSLTGPSQDGGSNADLSMYAESATADNTAAIAGAIINLYAQGANHGQSTVDIRTLDNGLIIVGQGGDTLIVDPSTIERPSGTRAYLTTFSDTNQCSSNLALTGANQAVPNCTFAITTTYANALYKCSVVVDMQSGSAGWGGVAEVFLNGSGLGSQAIAQIGSGQRVTVAQQYGGTLATPGNYTFTLNGARFAGTGGTMNATHTTIQLDILE